MLQCTRVGDAGPGVVEKPMIQITPQMRILLAVEPADFRKGIDGLAALCRQKLANEPMEGTMFVFRSRSAKAIKILVYDEAGRGGLQLASLRRGFEAVRRNRGPARPGTPEVPDGCSVSGCIAAQLEPSRRGGRGARAFAQNRRGDGRARRDGQLLPGSGRLGGLPPLFYAGAGRPEEALAKANAVRSQPGRRMPLSSPSPWCVSLSS